MHLTIPTDNPWVPLRILGLGKQAEDRIDADVFLLTDERPALLPAERRPHPHARPGSERLLLDDLRSDAGMGWVPDSAWLTKLEINSSAGDLSYDLAVDTTDARSPSRVAAGLELPLRPSCPASGPEDAFQRHGSAGSWRPDWSACYWPSRSPCRGQRRVPHGGIDTERGKSIFEVHLACG